MDQTLDRETALIAAAMELDAVGRTSSAQRLLNEARPLSKAGDRLRSFFAARKGISVVIVAQDEEASLHATLDSLDAQDFDKELFEVIVVASDTKQLTRPELTIQVCVTTTKNPLEMYLQGLRLAQHRYATVMQAGDNISRSCLRMLYVAASPQAIVIAPTEDANDEDSISLFKLIAAGASVVSLTKLSPDTYFSAIKLFPTGLSDLLPLPKENIPAHDWFFWGGLLAQNDLAIRLPHPLVVYGRRQRKSRKVSLSLEESLQSILALEAVLPCCDSPIFKRLCAALLAPLIVALKAGDSSWDNVVKLSQKYETSFDIAEYLAVKTAETLVVSYCFAPDADTSGIVMAKRLRELNGPVDVISNKLNDLHVQDPSLEALMKGYVGTHKILSEKQGYDDPVAIMDFAEQAALYAERRHYKTVYSRAMWPASHFAAALIKHQNPHIHWIAEFSDPLAFKIDGQPRRRKFPQHWLKTTGLWHAVRSRLPEIKPKDRLFFWAEALAYTLANELVFTNKNQRDYMLAKPWVGRKHIKRAMRVRVAAQPTLPATFYRMGQAWPTDDEKISIGYFGRFYKTRGAGHILEAIASLAPAVRAKILLYVYCPDGMALLTEARALGVSDNVVHRPLVPYLDFLSTLQYFDYLLISDTQTEDFAGQNPYLPSKLSDYLGANRPIWALTEPKSALAEYPLPLGSCRSVLGNLDDYTAALEGFYKQRVDFFDAD